MNAAFSSKLSNYPHRSAAGLRQKLILALVIITLLTACDKVKEQPISAGSVVLALGDSLTAGAGVTQAEAWPNLLANRSGWVVINGGINGDTSSAALRRLPALLEQHAPVLVMVTLGGNDMLRRIPQAETIANLEKIFSLIRAQGAKPLLLATPQPSLTAAVFQNLSAADFYRELAEAQRVPLIADAIAEVISDPQLKGDPLHPNAAGHALLSEMIFAELQAIGYAR